MNKTEERGLGWDRGISKLERLADVHQGAYLYVVVAAGLSLMAVVGSVWLIFTDQLSTGTALAIGTAAFVTYAYNAHFNRRSQIEQMNRQVIRSVAIFSRNLKWDPSDFRSEKKATVIAFGCPRSSCVRPVCATPLRFAATTGLPQMT